MDWHRFMLPPPPVEIDPPIVPLPKLEAPANERSTRGLDLWVRLASVWARCFGFDHSKRVRKAVDSIIERKRRGE